MQKRLLILSGITLLLFLSLFLHLYSITQNKTYQAFSQNMGKQTVPLYRTRGQIYDRNLTPLTRAYDVQQVEIAGKSTLYLAPARNDTAAPHLLGYLKDGKGVCGIEAAFDSFLSQNAVAAYAAIPTIGDGTALPDSQISLSVPPENRSGIVLTLDLALQKKVQSLKSDIKKGAVVCMDVKSGEILACASFPEYDNVADALSDPNTPLINRAFTAYPVGSVLKPVIAAAALETGISPHTAFECTGSTTIGQTTFRCHNRNGHGILNLYGALKQSCNPYFVQLTAQLPPELLIDTVYQFGFGQKIKLADSLYSAAGNLPDANMNAGEKANFSFGQGRFLATPLQICAAYAAIADNGNYHTPILITGTTENGSNISGCSIPQSTRIITEKTASILQDALYKAVMENETAKAKPDSGVVCGKTGTAQTGQFKDNRERLNGWFAGWYEYKGKTIAITVMVEDAVSGNDTAAPIVKMLAE